MFEILSFCSDLGWGREHGKWDFKIGFPSFVKLLKYLYLIAIFKTFIELSLTFLGHALHRVEERKLGYY